MSNLVTLGIAWIAGAVVVFIVGAAVWFVRELRTAPTEVEEVPLDDLLDDATAAEADVFPTGHFTREGWTEFAPGYWVRDVPHEENECALHEIPGFDAQFAGEVLADIDDLATTEEEAQ
jgi:hypothetical protein